MDAPLHPRIYINGLAVGKTGGTKRGGEQTEKGKGTQGTLIRLRCQGEARRICHFTDVLSQSVRLCLKFDNASTGSNVQAGFH